MNNSGPLIVLFIARCVFGVYSCCAADAQPKDLGVIGSIESAWRERESHFGECMLKWSEEEFLAKGGIVREGAVAPVIPAPFPPQDHISQHQYRLLYSDGKVRLEYKGERFSGGDSEWHDFDSIGTWNSTEARQLAVMESGQWPEGRIWARASEVTSAFKASLPWRLAFWPLNPNCGGVKLSDYTARAGSVPLGKQRCVVLERVRNRGFMDELWLDENREYVVCRVLDKEQSFVCWQCDIQYREQPGCGWIPAAWQWKSFNGTEYAQTMAAEVTECKVGITISDEEFRVKFPPGTYVENTVTKRNYMVRDDLSLREVLPQEMIAGVTAKMLMATNTGELIVASRTSFFRRIVFGMTVIVVVVLAIMLFKRRLVIAH